MSQKNFRIRKVLTEQNKSKVKKYQELIIGRSGLWQLIKHELIVTLCNWLPGALGLFLRSKLYPLMLGKVGRNVTFGTNVVFRHPYKVFIGDDVVIDDNCLLDAKGSNNKGIFIGDKVFIGRNSILCCKDGDIRLEEGVNIGFNCDITSTSSVTLRKNTLVAAYSYIVGGGNYDIDRTDITFAEQLELPSKGGIEVEPGTWIATHAVVLDGVTIGRGSVIGAGAIVDKSVPEYSVAAGVPARVLRSRQMGE